MTGIDETVVENAARVRRERRIKPPGAMIPTAAISERTYLLTRAAKDFTSEGGMIVIPFKV